MRECADLRRFNIIWIDPYPYADGVTAQESENCPGLDS